MRVVLLRAKNGSTVQFIQRSTGQEVRFAIGVSRSAQKKIADPPEFRQVHFLRPLEMHVSQAPGR